MARRIPPQTKSKARKRFAEGWSEAQVAEECGISTGLAHKWAVEFRGQGRPKPDPKEPEEPAPPPEAPGEALTVEQLQAWVSDQVRRQRDEAARCAAQEDSVGQQRAAKTMAMFAAMLSRMLPKADESDVIRVRMADMEAAAQQTRDDLERLLARAQEAGPDPVPFDRSPAQSWIRRLLSALSSTR